MPTKAPMTVLEVISAFNNPLAKEALDITNDEFFLASIKKEFSERQELRMVLEFLSEKREQQNKFRKERLDQAYKENLENIREQEEKKQASETKAISENQTQAAKEVIASFEKAWSSYQETATKETKDFLQNAFNKGEILNDQGERISLATLNKLMANAAPANPVEAFQRYAISAAKAGQAVTTPNATSAITQTYLLKTLKDIGIAGADKNPNFNLASILKKADASFSTAREKIRRELAKLDVLKEKDKPNESKYEAKITSLLAELEELQKKVSSYASESTSKMLTTVKRFDNHAKETAKKTVIYLGEKMTDAFEAVKSLLPQQVHLASKDSSFRFKNE